MMFGLDIKVLRKRLADVEGRVGGNTGFIRDVAERLGAYSASWERRFSGLQSKLDKHINATWRALDALSKAQGPIDLQTNIELDEVDSAGELVPARERFILRVCGEGFTPAKSRKVPVEDVIDAILDHLGVTAYYDIVNDGVVLYEQEAE